MNKRQRKKYKGMMMALNGWFNNQYYMLSFQGISRDIWKTKKLFRLWRNHIKPYEIKLVDLQKGE